MEQDLSWSIAKAGLPLITIELTTDDGNKGNLCFLIDTGATITSTSPSLSLSLKAAVL